MYKDVTKLLDLTAAIFTTPFVTGHVNAGMDKPRYSISRSAIREDIPSTVVEVRLTARPHCPITDVWLSILSFELQAIWRGADESWRRRLAARWSTWLITYDDADEIGRRTAHDG